MEKISRSQKKREAQALQKLGEQLVGLSDAQFALLKLPEELIEAVALARKLKRHEARRRQLQYIGRLMRSFDSDLVRTALEEIGQGEDAKKRRFKLAESWRAELVSGNRKRFSWLVEKFPEIDPNELDKLVRGARGQVLHINAKEASRRLFRYLHALGSDVGSQLDQ